MLKNTKKRFGIIVVLTMINMFSVSALPQYEHIVFAEAENTNNETENKDSQPMNESNKTTVTTKSEINELNDEIKKLQGKMDEFHKNKDFIWNSFKKLKEQIEAITAIVNRVKV